MRFNAELCGGMGHSLTKGEDNIELCRRSLAGDTQARADLARNNMPLVLTLVRRYLRAHPMVTHLQDDLTGAGMLALSIAADKSGRLPILHPNTYLGRAVYRAISRAADGLRDQAYWAEENCFSEQAVADVTAADPFVLRDLIDACCQTDGEREVVALRSLGCTHREVAHRLGIPYSRARLTVQNIFKRYVHRTGGSRDSHAQEIQPCDGN